jgi:hypothetical protein
MFKRPKPKQFNLKTRYYNPEEEKREKRKQKIARSQESYDFNPDQFREELSYRWSLHRESKSSFNQKNTSTHRLLLYLLLAAALVALLYYLRSN